MESKYTWVTACVVFLGVLACGSLGVGVASAQDVVESERKAGQDDETLQQMMSLSIPAESARYYAKLMGMDELQREIAAELHREYLSKYRDAAMRTRDVIEQAESGDIDAEELEDHMRGVMRVVLGFLDHVVKLGDQYVADLRMLAADETQQALHERVVRTRHRELAVAILGMDGGEGSADLIQIARGLEPPVLPIEGAGPAAEALLAYERELESRCEPFVTKAFQAYRDMLESFVRDDIESNTENEFQTTMQTMATAMDAANNSYARRVQMALPESRRAEWDRAYKLARWSAIYAPGPVHRSHDAALKLADLTDEQRESVIQTLAIYEREVELVNQRWISAVRELNVARLAMDGDTTMTQWETYEAANQAVREAVAARKAFDERFVARIGEFLSPQQQDDLGPQIDSGVDADEVVRQMGGG